MTSLILLLKKFRSEVGLNLFRVGWGFLEVLYNTARPVAPRIRQALHTDRKHLLARLDDPASLLRRAACFGVTNAGPAMPCFTALTRLDRPDRWRWTSHALAYLATIRWDDVADPRAHVAFLYEKDDAYFRTHPLNKGRNDWWEYYLVPWHRTYGRLTVALLDERMRPLLLPIWHRFDHWYRTERPWMTRLIVGSNISAVLAGYTLHSLLGVLLHEDPSDRRWYLDRYVTYAGRLYKALRASFDLEDGTATPFEGVLYGSFWFRTAIILGLVQRALGLHSLLDEPELATLAEYTWKSRTPDGEFQTSGDSKAFLAGRIPAVNVYALLAAANDDPYARKLYAASRQPSYLAEALPKEKPPPGP